MQGLGFMRYLLWSTFKAGQSHADQKKMGHLIIIIIISLMRAGTRTGFFFFFFDATAPKITVAKEEANFRIGPFREWPRYHIRQIVKFQEYKVKQSTSTCWWNPIIIITRRSKLAQKKKEKSKIKNQKIRRKIIRKGPVIIFNREGSEVDWFSSSDMHDARSGGYLLGWGTRTNGFFLMNSISPSHYSACIPFTTTIHYSPPLIIYYYYFQSKKSNKPTAFFKKEGRTQS